MHVREWLMKLFRPSGRLGGPAGGPHPNPPSHRDTKK